MGNGNLVVHSRFALARIDGLIRFLVAIVDGR